MVEIGAGGCGCCERRCCCGGLCSCMRCKRARSLTGPCRVRYWWRARGSTGCITHGWCSCAAGRSQQGCPTACQLHQGIQEPRAAVMGSVVHGAGNHCLSRCCRHSSSRQPLPDKPIAPARSRAGTPGAVNRQPSGGVAEQPCKHSTSAPRFAGTNLHSVQPCMTDFLGWIAGRHTVAGKCERAYFQIHTWSACTKLNDD
mmetsp:Transcript_3577/g.10001  ORF Transcript_3577/g.10001 Transcript_3577/m.10001 type:complete len:200 (-) Transcript_3577:361-960(-)